MKRRRRSVWPNAHRGRLLIAAGMYPVPLQNYYVTALELCRAGVETARAVGDRWIIAWGVQKIGWVCLMRGELDNVTDCTCRQENCFGENVESTDASQGCQGFCDELENPPSCQSEI